MARSAAPGVYSRRAASAGRSGSAADAKEIFFASTRDALDIVAEYAGVRLRATEVRDGTFFALQAGRVARTSRFRTDRDYVEESPLPTVRAPGESAHCLARLAAIVTAA